MNLIHDLLSLPEVPVAHLGDSDFAASIAASNGMPTPYDLLVHCRLSVAPMPDQIALHTHEHRRKVWLLDRDRRAAACVCEFEAASAPEHTLLHACLGALAAPTAPLVLACTAAADPAPPAPLSRVAEIIISATSDQVPGRIAAHLRTWRETLAPSVQLVVALRADPVHDRPRSVCRRRL